MEPIASEILLEDYRTWMRELEKQDRWLYQGVWTVLVASGTAFWLIRAADHASVDLRSRVLAAIAVGLVAITFLVINGDFLGTRVSSHRMVSRRVAAVRKVARSFDLLGADADRASGVPMLSDNPDTFVRTALAGKSRSYSSLLLLHVIALWMVYAMICGFLWTEGIPTERALGIPLSIGLLNYAWVACRWRYRAAASESLDSFLVTLFRDLRVKVAPNAEERLGDYLRGAKDLTLVDECPAVARVIVKYEDRRFWFHPGFDLIAIAVRLVGRRKRGGASTIPMQLARQLIPDPLRNSQVRRKVFELVLGTWLVVRYGRRRVLAAWLMRVPYGRSSIIGLAAAAEKYFCKRPEELDEVDALCLAERVTVYTGRYYPKRMERLAAWALSRGLITAEQRAVVGERYEAMGRRVPT